MQIKNLRKLGKTELLEIICEQEKKIENLNEKIENLNNKLENREIKIKEAGSIAEASIILNEIFEKAQKAADEYLKNIKEQNPINQVYAENEESVTKEELLKEQSEEVEENNLKLPVEKKNDIKKWKDTFINIIRKKIKLLLRKAKNVIKVIINGIITLVIKIYKLSKDFIIELPKEIKKLYKSIRRTVKDKAKAIKLSLNNRFLDLKSKCKQIKIHFIKKLEIRKNNIQNSKYFNKNTSDNKKREKYKFDAKNYEISVDELEAEIKKRKKVETRRGWTFKTIFSIVVIIAFAIILSNKIFYILQVSGDSMSPTLDNGDLLITSKIFGFEKSDIIAFYYNDNVLIKRVIATEGDIVNIDDDGRIYVNNIELKEDYVGNLSYGNCDITLPYKVPENSLFILGDNRETSLDSRNKAIGVIQKDKVIGKISMRINKLKFY